MQQGPTRHAVMTAHADASVECVAVIVSSRVQYPTGTGFETERPTVDIDVYTGGMKSSASATKIPIETFVKPSNHNAEQHSNPEKHSNQFPRILSVHVVRTIAATVPCSCKTELPSNFQTNRASNQGTEIAEYHPLPATHHACLLVARREADLCCPLSALHPHHPRSAFATDAESSIRQYR